MAEKTDIGNGVSWTGERFREAAVRLCEFIDLAQKERYRRNGVYILRYGDSRTYEPTRLCWYGVRQTRIQRFFNFFIRLWRKIKL